MKNILEAAKVIRSKNSGPFELTFDIMFKNKEYFRITRFIRGSKEILSRLPRKGHKGSF